MRTKTSIHYWRFDDGKNYMDDRELLPRCPPGWYCWVYPSDDYEFVSWMTKHCPTADCIHRFNNGDPMHTVYISDEKEASMFLLRWGS